MSSAEALVEQIYSQYDADHDGNMTLAESRPFYESLVGKRADLGLTLENHQEWFAKIDKNSSGTITKDELVEYFKSINFEG
jgi:Ca2+-binding EF-hand superfamily protein